LDDFFCSSRLKIDFLYASVKARTNFLLGALLAFFVWDLGLFDVFLPTHGQKLVPGIEPLTVQSLDIIHKDSPRYPISSKFQL